MITVIKGGYIVAFDGKEHRILMDGKVVVEDDKIKYVGKSYAGSVDRARLFGSECDYPKLKYFMTV